MVKFIHANIGFYYGNTDGLYIENKHWDNLDKAGFVGKSFLQGENDYKGGGFIYGLFLAPKIKYCLFIRKYDVIDEHRTFKGFTNFSGNLDSKEYFKMFNGNKFIAKVPFGWKKSFSYGVVIPHKMRIRNKCKKEILCDRCDKLVNQNKGFSANLN